VGLQKSTETPLGGGGGDFLPTEKGTGWKTEAIRTFLRSEKSLVLAEENGNNFSVAFIAS